MSKKRRRDDNGDIATTTMMQRPVTDDHGERRQSSERQALTRERDEDVMRPQRHPPVRPPAPCHTRARQLGPWKGNPKKQRSLWTSDPDRLHSLLQLPRLPAATETFPAAQSSVAATAVTAKATWPRRDVAGLHLKGARAPTHPNNF
jgi:hypothetical protein